MRVSVVLISSEVEDAKSFRSFRYDVINLISVPLGTTLLELQGTLTETARLVPGAVYILVGLDKH
jgi:hypothetical protein